MKLFGLDLRSLLGRKSTDVATSTSVPAPGWTRWATTVQDFFPGAWQRNLTLESTENMLAFSAVYACVSLIAGDISKLRIQLVRQDDNGIWTETKSPAFSPVLRKPNLYQTRIQFLSHWVVSKLLWGNTYVYLVRDDRQVVIGMYVLDPRLITPIVTSSGNVYYQLSTDKMSGITGPMLVPASEIIHDRAECLFHPLIGVGPIYAAGYSATQGKRIQTYAGKFFENMSRPSGMLTSEHDIPDETALRLKGDFERNFSGSNLGRLLVAGSGLKYEAFTMPANQAQLIEQLKWTGEDVARCFHVPAYKLGLGAPPTLNNIGAMQQDYYDQALQNLIENIELLLDEALGLTQISGQTLGTQLDLDGLLRMDPLSMMDSLEKGVKAGILAPNEARRRINQPPVNGGESPYMQQQQFPLEVLAKQPPPGTTPPAAVAPAPAPAPAGEPAAAPQKALEQLGVELAAHIDAVAAAEVRREAEAETMRELVSQARTASETIRAESETIRAETETLAVARAALAAEQAADEEAFADFMTILATKIAEEAEHG